MRALLCLALLGLAAVPASARLYFNLPETQSLNPGDIHLDFGAVYGEYLLVAELEDRWYVPDLRAQAQLYPRIALDFQYFGIYRAESVYQQPVPLRDDVYAGADLAFSVLVDLQRARGGRGWAFKTFAMAKLPNAGFEERLGSDRSDIFLGFTGDWRGERFHFSGMARLDIVGRPDREGQWDYAVLGMRGGLRLGARLGLLAEAWRRERSQNATTLVSAGLAWRLSAGVRLEALAGDGGHEFYETNLDSRLRRQYSLRLKWRFHAKGLARWLD